MPRIADPAPPVRPPEGLCRLPQFRPVALKLLQLLSTDEVDFSAVVNLLSSDPAFSAELLAFANSPLYASRLPATSLQRAIVVLGLDRTRSLTLTVAMQAFVGNVRVTPELQNSWRHCLAAALLAEELASIYGIQRDLAYTAGLMHDIGRLGLLKAYPGPYARLLNTAHENVAELLEAERTLFQADHCQSGLWLTHSWALPAEFQQIAAHHHDGRFERALGVIGMTAAACHLADALGFASVNYRQPLSAGDVLASLPQSARFDPAQLTQRILERLEKIELTM